MDINYGEKFDPVLDLFYQTGKPMWAFASTHTKDVGQKIVSEVSELIAELTESV